MTIRKLHIRHWTILFFFSFDARNAEDIEKALIWAGAPDSIMEQVQTNVFAERRDEGFCFSNPSLRRSVVAVGKTSTGPEFMNTTIHEIAHVELAYLMGDISHDISYIVCELSCPHCSGV